MARTICEGWNVLEVGNASIAASLAGMLLADNGARVVKVEPPDGDRLRHQLPPGFLVWNRGKESMVADLRTPEGREMAAEQARRADVLLAGADPATLQRWGLDDRSLRAANPALVSCCFSGFGPTGAYASLRAHEGVVAAKAGLFARGQFAFRPGPLFFSVPWGSVGAAHLGLAGVLAALMVRERTGRGQRVDATLAQGLTALDYFGTMHWQYAKKTGNEPQVVIGTGGAMAASRYMLWMCTKDGAYLTSTPQLPNQARALIRAAGVEHILDDPRFANAPVFPTAEDAQAWEDLMWETFRQRTLGEWLPILEADPDISFEVARTSEEALDHPQLLHNGESLTIEDPRLGRVRMIGPLARFEKTPSQVGRLAPDLDDHRQLLSGPAALPAGGEPAPPHPLSGVTIVEAGYFFAMPFGLTNAAALGARVIKLEAGEGDPMRAAFGAPETAAARVMEGKESLSIDLHHPDSRGVMRRLIARADAFVTSFRPGVPQRLGLDYQTLRTINPRLVYVYAGGYGSSGPYANRACYATSASTAVGAIRRLAGEWVDPDFVTDFSAMEIQAIVKPHLNVPVDGDSNAALSVLSALMLGLTHQRRTGEGQLVECSMIGGNALTYADDFNAYEGKPPYPQVDQDARGLSALYRLYPTAEGWVFLAAPTEREWHRLVEVLGRPALAGDPRFSSEEARAANDRKLVAELSTALAERPAAEWESKLTEAGVGCAVAFEGGNSAFTSTDPVLRETGLTAEVDHPLFGRIVRHGLPVALSETPGRLARGCLRGEHTEAILADVGYSEEEIRRLEEAKAVFGPDPR